jgi:hypothetical protein
MLPCLASVNAMPRRNYDDDDDDFDDRPRPRTRRRYEDDDEDYDPRPGRRQGSSGSNVAIIVIAVAAGGGLLLVLAGFGAYFALRSRPVAAPVVVNNPVPPPVIAPPPPVIGAPALPVIPGMPVVPGPGIPAAGNQIAISNLRTQRGFAGRTELVFDYTFPAGRAIGLYTAVVTEPGGQPATADLHFLNQQGAISLRAFGPGGGNFRSGTQVYVGNHAIGLRNIPSPISNTLTLP